MLGRDIIRNSALMVFMSSGFKPLENNIKDVCDEKKYYANGL